MKNDTLNQRELLLNQRQEQLEQRETTLDEESRQSQLPRTSAGVASILKANQNVNLRLIGAIVF